MANVLIRAAEEPVTLTAQTARRLVERGDGDAALLYLALLRHQGSVPPRSLARELRWERGRIEAAEQVLRELELVSAPEEPENADERPEYRQTDIAMRLEDSEDFRRLTSEVEHRLGKKLTTPDLGILLGLYDHLGLPSHVIYLLVCHCAERTADRYGGGRRPTMRQIEQEGYVWARQGIFSQSAVEDYLQRYALRKQAFSAYMRVLRLGDRLPVPSEEKYLSGWQEMGFPPDTVALAYDRTVLHCHEFKWSYCNGILKRWHRDGLHTPAEVESHDRPGDRRTRRDGSAERDEEIRRYAQELHRDRENRQDRG